MQVLHETQAKERSIEEELEKLLQQREQLEGMLLQLHSSTREVQLHFAAWCCKEVPNDASPQQLSKSKAVSLLRGLGTGLAVQLPTRLPMYPATPPHGLHRTSCSMAYLHLHQPGWPDTTAGLISS